MKRFRINAWNSHTLPTNVFNACTLLRKIPWCLDSRKSHGGWIHGWKKRRAVTSRILCAVCKNTGFDSVCVFTSKPSVVSGIIKKKFPFTFSPKSNAISICHQFTTNHVQSTRLDIILYIEWSRVATRFQFVNHYFQMFVEDRIKGFNDIIVERWIQILSMESPFIGYTTTIKREQIQGNTLDDDEIYIKWN